MTYVLLILVGANLLVIYYYATCNQRSRFQWLIEWICISLLTWGFIGWHHRLPIICIYLIYAGGILPLKMLLIAPISLILSGRWYED